MDKRELEKLKQHEDALTEMVDRAWEKSDGSWQRSQRLEALRYALASVKRDIAAVSAPTGLKRTA